MRSLGELYRDATTHDCRMMLLIEMAARSIKVLLRRRMRQMAEELTFPLEQPYIAMVVEMLNQGTQSSVQRRPRADPRDSLAVFGDSQVRALAP